MAQWHSSNQLVLVGAVATQAPPVASPRQCWLKRALMNPPAAGTRPSMVGWDRLQGSSHHGMTYPWAPLVVFGMTHLRVKPVFNAREITRTYRTPHPSKIWDRCEGDRFFRGTMEYMGRKLRSEGSIECNPTQEVLPNP